MKSYIHRVHYYETDKMAITHHSNYIRWMEEARVDFLDQIGWNFAKLEALGIASPVVKVDCTYKVPTKFDDLVEITTSIDKYTGVKLVLHYVMKLAGTDTIVCVAESAHAFTNEAGRLISIKKSLPEMDQSLKQCLASY